MSIEKTTSDLSSMTMDDDNESDRKLLIAVDFGTTFSGVAWAQTRRVWSLPELLRIRLLTETLL